MRRKRRLFFAIGIPRAAREALVRFSKKHKKIPVRWVPKKNFHATVLFWGSTDEGRISELRKAAVGILRKDALRDEVRFTHIDWGPPKGPTRMIWLYGEAGPSWHRLKSTLRQAYMKRGLYRGTDEWPFLPHVTVARVELKSRRATLPRIETAFDTVFRPSELLLMESHLSPRGPNYEVLDRIALSREEPA
ncbi:MAG: RNA 2',3'-cyclic phosphodiesterase [Candidatus Terrybacteria bacterium]|nr:RNA 2',3'-cyclic phosphodiesterase [Candidatus Terrybacteria bacterium]